MSNSADSDETAPLLEAVWPGPAMFALACLLWLKWAASWENQHSGFRSGLTQTRLYSYRRWLEAWNFGFRKKRDCTIRVAKTMALISFAVTAKLICVFVFACAKRWFSHDVAQKWKLWKVSVILTFLCLLWASVLYMRGAGGRHSHITQPCFTRLC